MQLRYNSTIILVIHYQTHSDPYTKKDNFSTCLLTQFISKQEVVTDITLIEILQVLRTCYCNCSFTKPKKFPLSNSAAILAYVSDLVGGIPYKFAIVHRAAMTICSISSLSKINFSLQNENSRHFEY